MWWLLQVKGYTVDIARDCAAVILAVHMLVPQRRLGCLGTGNEQSYPSSPSRDQERVDCRGPTVLGCPNVARGERA